MLPGVVFCTSVSVSTFVAHSSAPACRLEKSEHLDPRKGDKSPDWTHTHTHSVSRALVCLLFYCYKLPFFTFRSAPAPRVRKSTHT